MLIRPLASLAALALLSASGFCFAQEPKFQSKVINRETPGHAVEIDVDVTGAKELYLVVRDGGDGFGADWADWAEPRLVTPSGEKKLTEIKWKSAGADWGNVAVGKNAGGDAMKIAGKAVEYGIGTHANSVIGFDLPAGTTRFKARGGIDNGGSGQPLGSSVQFAVYTQKPPVQVTQGSVPAGGGSREAKDAVSGLDVAEGLEALLFASEASNPAMLNPTSIDIDHLGRVWVCEVVNYRHRKGERKEGDRILILEDTNGDGVADKQTVFHQGTDVDSAHGICVLPTPSGKGTKIIVSANDNVFFLHDEDGDLKSDKKEMLFTGIAGTQHDHGIHAFHFGPDGKLYFNFGNSGNQIKDKDGKQIVDMAGNEVTAARKPYQEGMVFRCNMDGSEFETLGWNFRNNWELCVDSFGTVWQSDNDDDGNKGVRINYVMEYGNYGYKDELTGAGWQTPRTNMEEEIPRRHWHLNDPGVVPNLLQTGAGSPTGILIYEGDKLPERFINQLIHCDAGPNVVRSYAVTDDGAGYKAEINDILNGTRDQWFRPSDVCVAPDGSLIVADWYDPGVGGHRQGDIDRGRLFRVALPGQKYSVPKHDFSTVEGAAEALKSPNTATRYLAFTKLKESGAAAEAVLAKMFESDPNPRFRSRALWLLGQIEGKTQKYVDLAIGDKDKDIRIAGIRLARRRNLDAIPVVEKMVKDESPQVRRECAIFLSRTKLSDRISLWNELARTYPKDDRWYLEAIGIAAGGNNAGDWDSLLSSSNARPQDAEVHNDIIWRSRGRVGARKKGVVIQQQVENIAVDEFSSASAFPNATAEVSRMFRSLDFEDNSIASTICMELLEGVEADEANTVLGSFVVTESLNRLEATEAADARVKKILGKSLDGSGGTSTFTQLVKRFQITDRYPELLLLSQQRAQEQVGVEAISALLELKQWDLIGSALRGDDTAAAIATADALGNSQNGAISGLLLPVVNNAEVNIDVRRAAVKAASKAGNAAMELVKLVDEKTLDPELEQSVAAALHSSPHRNAREAAQRLFPLPPSKDNMPTPPISELAKLQGDVANGRMVYFSTGTCHKCHVVDGMGREIGPNLTEIGSKLSREAMFESVLYPSAGISHNFELWTVVKTDGTTLNGLLVSNTDAEVTIKGDDALVRAIPKSEVEELVKQKISLMPADLQKTMTTQELADVVDYMQTLKKK